MAFGTGNGRLDTRADSDSLYFGLADCCGVLSVGVVLTRKLRGRNATAKAAETAKENLKKFSAISASSAVRSCLASS
jgi:hypothetical protein